MSLKFSLVYSFIDSAFFISLLSSIFYCLVFRRQFFLLFPSFRSGFFLPHRQFSVSGLWRGSALWGDSGFSAASLRGRISVFSCLCYAAILCGALRPVILSRGQSAALCFPALFAVQKGRALFSRLLYKHGGKKSTVFAFPPAKNALFAPFFLLFPLFFRRFPPASPTFASVFRPVCYAQFFPKLFSDCPPHRKQPKFKRLLHFSPAKSSRSKSEEGRQPTSKQLFRQRPNEKTFWQKTDVSAFLPQQQTAFYKLF